jgi:hypothetical protein
MYISVNFVRGRNPRRIRLWGYIQLAQHQNLWKGCSLIVWARLPARGEVLLRSWLFWVRFPIRVLLPRSENIISGSVRHVGEGVPIMTDNVRVFHCKQIRDVFSVGNYPHNYSLLSAGFTRGASQSEFEICAVRFFIMNPRPRDMKTCL